MDQRAGLIWNLKNPDPDGMSRKCAVNRTWKALQMAETYCLYAVWHPMGELPDLAPIHNPAAQLDHAKSEIVAERSMKF